MIAMFIVARIVGPGVLGTLAFGLAFVSMFLFVADLGLGSAHIKLISEGRDESECIGTYALLKSAVNVLFAVITLGYYLIQKYILEIPFESREHEIVILIYLVITTVSQFFLIPSTTFAAKTEQAKQDIPNFIQILLYQILRVIAAVAGLKAIGLAFSNLAAVLLVIPVYFYLFKDYKIGRFNRELAKEYFKISLPVIVVIIVQTLIYSSDRVVLQYLTNSVEVGYYSAGFAISQFIKLIESSVGLLFFPLFSGLLANRDFEKLNSSINKYERFNIVYILPVVAAVSISSDLVVKLALGSKYTDTIPVLGFINISMYISLISLPYLNLISGKGLFKLSALIHVWSLAVYFAAAYLFVSPGMLGLKGTGIAISLITVNLVLGLTFIYFVGKRIPEIKVLKDKYLFLFGITFSLLFLAVYNLIPDNIYSHFAAVLIFLAVYFATGYFGRIFSRDDYRMVFEIINSRKMFDYINKEITKKKK